MTAVLVAAGAAAGAVLRLLASYALPGRLGTFAVNVLGSLLIGVVAGQGPGAYALLATGFAGALTTFSTFAVQAGEPGLRWRYVAATTVCCLSACGLGLAVGELLQG